MSAGVKNRVGEVREARLRPGCLVVKKKQGRYQLTPHMFVSLGFNVSPNGARDIHHKTYLYLTGPLLFVGVAVEGSRVGGGNEIGAVVSERGVGYVWTYEVEEWKP